MSVKIEIFGEDAGHALLELKGLSSGLFRQAEAPLTAVQQSIKDGTFSVRSATDEERAAVGIAPAPEASAPAAEEAPKRTRKKKADEPATQAISTGEERVSPEDAADVQDQDKADEQAEVEATRDAEKAYTLDDVKNSFGLYIQKFGMDAVKEDGINILADTLANEKLPAGENFWKATIIPEARYGDVIAAFQAAASAEQRYKRRGA